MRANAQIEQLSARSVPIGLFKVLPADEHITRELTLGDRLILYSDGVTDIFNVEDQILGLEGFQRILIANAGLKLPEMKQAILDTLEKFRSGPHYDDMSLIMIEV
jgi:serine phosphatase RsbU (regulator of sigma subunit)